MSSSIAVKRAYVKNYPEQNNGSYTSRSRSQWPRGLRRASAASRLLGLRVRIPPGPWMSACCECCVWSGRVFSSCSRRGKPNIFSLIISRWVLAFVIYCVSPDESYDMSTVVRILPSQLPLHASHVALPT